MTSQIALVVEELSPDEKVTPVVLRMLQYLNGGVPLVWLVDNVERGVIVYRKGDSSHFFKEGEQLIGPQRWSIDVSELLTPSRDELAPKPRTQTQSDGR